MAEHDGIEKVRAYIGTVLANRQTFTLEERRKAVDALAALAPLPAGTTGRLVRLGRVPAEKITPDKTADNREAARALLYLHGGAFVAGSALSHRQITTRLALETGLPVHALEYRLAPEHPFPAALDDCIAAYQTLLEQTADAAGIVLVGDSAGGNLVLSTLCRLRDEGIALPGAAVAISPSTDLTCASDSYETCREADFFLTRAGLEKDFATYLAGASPLDPAASPLHHALHGLPPLLIQVGSREVLLDDSRRFVDKLRAAGGAAELEIWPDMVHVWHLFPHWLPEARAAVRHIARFIARHTARP